MRDRYDFIKTFVFRRSGAVGMNVNQFYSTAFDYIMVDVAVQPIFLVGFYCLSNASDDGLGVPVYFDKYDARYFVDFQVYGTGFVHIGDDSGGSVPADFSKGVFTSFEPGVLYDLTKLPLRIPTSFSVKARQIVQDYTPVGSITSYFDFSLSFGFLYQPKNEPELKPIEQ